MRRPVAILCSGQGGQHSGMFDLVANCPAAEPVFIAASQQLGQDPRQFVREAGTTDLFSDRAGQILCCTQALAIWAGLTTARPARAVIAGLSVGELAAWGCAGALDVAATLLLARRRAALMDAAAPPDSGLAVIVGLRRAALEPILHEHAAAIAIIHDIDHFVIGGLRDALDAACREAAARGATRAIRLPVAIPSHTQLLSGALDLFRDALRLADTRLPETGFRLLTGIDGGTVQGIEAGCDKLARQICSPVEWASCLASCREEGAALVLELGPGSALSREAVPLFPIGRVRAAEEFSSLDGLRAWLSRARD